MYTPHDYANQLKSMNVERSIITKQITEIYGETKAIIKDKKANTQERIQEYLKEHPNATQKEIAQTLNYSLRTVKTYAKKR